VRGKTHAKAKKDEQEPFSAQQPAKKDKRVLLSNIRPVAGENGLSVGERTFASGAPVMSVSALDNGKGRWRQLRLVGPREPWTDALLEDDRNVWTVTQSRRKPSPNRYRRGGSRTFLLRRRYGWCGVTGAGSRECIDPWIDQKLFSIRSMTYLRVKQLGMY
jgi:hypothetical protein